MGLFDWRARKRGKAECGRDASTEPPGKELASATLPALVREHPDDIDRFVSMGLLVPVDSLPCADRLSGVDYVASRSLGDFLTALQSKEDALRVRKEGEKALDEARQILAGKGEHPEEKLLAMYGDHADRRSFIELLKRYDSGISTRTLVMIFRKEASWTGKDGGLLDAPESVKAVELTQEAFQALIPRMGELPVRKEIADTFCRMLRRRATAAEGLKAESCMTMLRSSRSQTALEVLFDICDDLISRKEGSLMFALQAFSSKDASETEKWLLRLSRPNENGIDNLSDALMNEAAWERLTQVYCWGGCQLGAGIMDAITKLPESEKVKRLLDLAAVLEDWTYGGSAKCAPIWALSDYLCLPSVIERLAEIEPEASESWRKQLAEARVEAYLAAVEAAKGR